MKLVACIALAGLASCSSVQAVDQERVVQSSSSVLPPIEAFIAAPTTVPSSTSPSSTATADASVRLSETVAVHPGLLDPTKANAQAPARFTVELETTAGPLTFACTRSHGPFGADRIFNLVQIGFFSDVAFFRVVKTPRPFVIQFGISGDPRVSRAWRKQALPPDPVVVSNKTGTITFAMAGSPDTRTTQLFINLGDNTALDAMGFAPICELVGENDATIARINGEYGELPTSKQGDLQSEGSRFLAREFPNLDFIIRARIVPSALP
jgi:peptidyl-prolyl cis-trans isomerase A (cyclophilin A)